MRRLSTAIIPLCFAMLLPAVALATPGASATPTRAVTVAPTAAPTVAPTAAPTVQAAPMAAPLAQPWAAPQPTANRRAPYAPAPNGRRIRQQNNKHGLGLSLGMSPGFGFAYRNYFGNTVVQASVFAAILDRGDNSTIWVGVQVARYLLVWQQSRRRSLLPRTSALRLVGGGSYLYSTSVDTVSRIASGCKPTVGGSCPRVDSKQVNSTKFASLGAGIGFEFGAIMRPGVSFAIDLQLTAMFDKGVFQQLWPLPSVALMYSW